MVNNMARMLTRKQYKAGIPANWVSKTLDVCILVSSSVLESLSERTRLTLMQGDGVCDTRDGVGITAQHLQYPGDASTQNLGTNFILGKLRGTS